jgi:RNA polymerase sigma-70 factor (ECF subfamily)
VWLYQIATNACLDVRRQAVRRAGSNGGIPPLSHLPWIQPYPDRLLDQIAPSQDEPDAVLVARETIELTFLAALQLLPPRQRAVLILRDILDWSTAETAELLDTGASAVNSALQRARATIRKHWSRESPPQAPTASERSLLRSYIQAHERGDPAAVIELLDRDVRMSISHLGHWDGRATVAAALTRGLGSHGQWRMTPVWANRQPAAATYLRGRGESTYRAFAVTLLRVDDGLITDISAFEVAGLFSAFALPSTLPEMRTPHER